MLGQVSFKSTKIFYSITGEGPTVVWLHGFMEDKSIWEGQLTDFDTKTTNICIDLLGHGQTRNIAQVHSMDLQSQAVETVLKHLSIDVYSIVGHSMGGYVGLQLLEKQSEKITHFVLLNSTSLPDSDEKKINRKRSLKIVAQQKDAYARMGVLNLFSTASRKLLTSDIERLIKVAQQTSVQGIAAALMGMMQRVSKQDVLKKYTGNKLIIAGEDDPVLLVKASCKEAKSVEALFTQLEGGHMSYLESKNQINTILRSFFGF